MFSKLGETHGISSGHLIPYFEGDLTFESGSKKRGSKTPSVVGLAFGLEIEPPTRVLM